MRFSGIVLVCIAAFLMLPFMPKSVFACSCATAPTAAEAIEKADSVFAGEVIGISDDQDEKGFPAKLVHIQASSIWKGPSQTVMNISTSAGGASCGYDFSLGKSYLVYAYKTGDGYKTDICTRTQLLEKAKEDLSVLGQGAAPASDEATESNPTSVVTKIILFAVALGLIAVNLMFLQKQRKKIR